MRRRARADPIQLRDDHTAFGGFGGGERGCKLRAPVKCVSAFAGLDLHELGNNGQSLGFAEARNRRALGFDP
jgi:hypothetical protein